MAKINTLTDEQLYDLLPKTLKTTIVNGKKFESILTIEKNEDGTYYVGYPGIDEFDFDGLPDVRTGLLKLANKFKM